MSEKCLIHKQSHAAHEYVIYLRGTIEDFEDYDNMVKTLAGIQAHDTLTVRLNSPGGDCSVGFFIIDQLLAVPCPVRMIVEYPTYSMGAVIALCGDDLILNPHTYIMFHDYSGGNRGKGEETQAYVNNYRKVFKDKFTMLCKPFLTQAEINKMFKGEDLYIHDDDPTLEKRIKRHFK